MNIYPYFHIDPKLLEAAQRAEELAQPQFQSIEAVQRYNQQKMLAAFNKAGVSESHFAASTTSSREQSISCLAMALP